MLNLIHLSLSSFVKFWRSTVENLFIQINGIGLLAAPILLVGNQYLSFGYLIILLFANYKIIQIDNNNNLKEPLERSLLLFTFINALYLLNEVSNWMVG